MIVLWTLDKKNLSFLVLEELLRYQWSAEFPSPYISLTSMLVFIRSFRTSSSLAGLEHVSSHEQYDTPETTISSLDLSMCSR
ncbi:hypothetical protein FRX31_012966 [Thalictrum thalictroides]|uniref:Uncharacterized protein n=1 Tax=Thalictrum thalictroides TaxID=46969 RepID=A0A7J6WKL2_THATH|nr:hypothetical protein FRX31_012966 [Thalictrum thalictroides]